MFRTIGEQRLRTGKPRISGHAHHDLRLQTIKKQALDQTTNCIDLAHGNRMDKHARTGCARNGRAAAETRGPVGANLSAPNHARQPDGKYNNDEQRVTQVVQRKPGVAQRTRARLARCCVHFRFFAIAASHFADCVPSARSATRPLLSTYMVLGISGEGLIVRTNSMNSGEAMPSKSLAGFDFR